MIQSNRATDYLDSNNIRYQLLSHPHSKSSIGSAISAEVPMHQLAKAVMLEDHEGKHLMAILPSDYKISLGKLQEELNRSFHLIKEAKVYELFTDCESGAIPPIPAAYNMDAIFDDELSGEPQVFLESGDHETLIKIERTDFMHLMEAHKHSRFSNKVIH